MSSIRTYLGQVLPHIENLTLSVGDESFTGQIWVALTTRPQLSRLLFDADLLEWMARAKVEPYLDAFRTPKTATTKTSTNGRRVRWV